MTGTFSLSRPFAVVDVPAKGKTVKIEATEAECMALAAELKLAGILSLTASLQLMPQGIRMLVGGEVRARVRYTCVVTLDPFETDVTEPVALAFADDPQTAPADADGEPPEPIVGGRIDLGAIAAEFLALGLDPHPRKPGVAFDPEAGKVGDAGSPFAALAALKKGS